MFFLANCSLLLRALSWLTLFARAFGSIVYRTCTRAHRKKSFLIPYHHCQVATKASFSLCWRNFVRFLSLYLNLQRRDKPHSLIISTFATKVFNNANFNFHLRILPELNYVCALHSIIHVYISANTHAYRTHAEPIQFWVIVVLSVLFWWIFIICGFISHGNDFSRKTRFCVVNCKHSAVDDTISVLPFLLKMKFSLLCSFTMKWSTQF